LGYHNNQKIHVLHALAPKITHHNMGRNKRNKRKRQAEAMLNLSGDKLNNNKNNNSDGTGGGGGGGNVKGNHNHNNHNNTNNKKNSNKRKSKQQKRERFWIEDCMETDKQQQQQQQQSSTIEDDSGKCNSKYDEAVSLEILITRSDLVDDYRQAPKLTVNVASNVVDGDDGNELVEVDDVHDKHIERETTVEDLDKAIVVDHDKKSDPSTDSTNREDQSDSKADEMNHTESSKETHRPKHINPTGEEEESKPKQIEAVQENKQDSNHQLSSPSSKPNNNNVFIAVKRAKSAKKPMVVLNDSVENFQPLPNGDCGDGIVNPHPNDVVPDKFWAQRRRLFTRFDDGIQLDKESWYSVTPESIATHIARHLLTSVTATATSTKSVVVLDLFCGCGGNAIQFALHDAVDLVVCVEKDESKLEKAASNAAIYGVPKTKLVFVHGHASDVLSCYENRNLMKSTTTSPESTFTDVSKQDQSSTSASSKSSHAFPIGGIELLPKRIDCIFLSPPWGGMDYGKVGKRNYTLQCIQLDATTTPTENNENGSSTTTTTTIDGEDILLESARALGRSGPIAVFLPRNINGIALGKSIVKSGYSGPVVMEQNVLNGKLKTVTAYIGLH
jgi:trimethylguanosine synthase